MNTSLQNNTCDPERLESFLSGDLSPIEERDFTLHLNTCESCRRSLQQQAAEPEAWTEAERLLKPSEFDLGTAEEDCGSSLRNRSTRQPLQIQNVLSALGPTDDPQMLGRLGGYEVSGVVGAGGMGVVLKAIDKSLDRTVAIKVLAPHLATSGAARKRFAREAKAAAAVLHPNVIAIHSVSNDESLPYLVMPYVRGTSLQKRLDKEGPLSLQEILRIGSQIAAGLAAAHAQGLVHRDIKPANILLEDGVERVTITDFGLARAVDDATITHSGVIAGTPQYMSPEQARGEAVDGRSDLFSLGSVLYAICTGRPPFRAETTYGVMRRITDDEPTSIREINPEIPDWLCSIIAKLMTKPATNRFASAAEVSDLFEKCLAHVQQPATVPLPQSCLSLRESDTPFAERKATILRRFSSLSRRTLEVFTMIAVLGLGLLGMAAWQASEAPDIAGKWTGEEWGEVVLEKQESGAYEGTYTDTFKKNPGTIQLKWSRLERRFNGTWREGTDRLGKISVRLVGDEIRGAWTTNKKSDINPGTPKLADLLWKRTSGKGDEGPGLSRTPPVPKRDFFVVEIYSGRGVKQQVLGKLVASLNELKGVVVNLHEQGEGDGIKAAFVQDPIYEGLMDEDRVKNVVVMRAYIGEVLRAGKVETIRWLQGNGKLQDGPGPRSVPAERTSIIPKLKLEKAHGTSAVQDPAVSIKADPYVPQDELVMNLGFERNGLGSATSVSPVLLQKGQIVKASEFRAYLEREKLSRTRQQGDAATKATTVRLNVDREVQFDAVTSLMKLCQEVGFQKFALRLDEDAVEKFVLEILRTPFVFDESKGSWQDGAYEMQVLMSLNMVRPRDRVVKTLLKVVDRSEKGTMDQRRLAMMSLGGMAPKQVIPLLIKELTWPKQLPAGFKTSFPYHEIAVLEQIGEEAKDAIPVLIKLLDSPDGLARESALLALVKIGPSSDEVMNAIAARFGKPDEPVWSRAVYEVGRYGTQAKPLGPTFVKLLGAKPKEVRIWAAQALIKSGFDEALGFETLIGDVAKGESADRGLAATALAALGSQAKPMIPKLRAFENDPDAHVRKEVRDAIRRIEKDDRIFTHAEEAAKTAASRKAAAEALEGPTTGIEAALSESEYQRLEGVWRLASRIVSGVTTLDEFKMGGIYDIRNRHLGDARISLNPAKSPAEINLTITKGPDSGKVLHGIYEWVVDPRGSKFLAISVSSKLTKAEDVVSQRPKDFTVREGVDYVLLEKIRSGGQSHNKPIASPPEGKDSVDPYQAEYQRFEGTWRISLRTIDHAVSLGEFGMDGKHVIKDRQMGDARISLDPSKTPREIDIAFTKGPDKGKVLRGIYEWVDDARGTKLVRISVSTNLTDPGDGTVHRPQDFKTRTAVDFAVWEQIVVRDPSTVDSAPKGDELRFSDTQEVVLSMDSLKFMLDLDTGKTMDPPATIRPEQEQMDVQTDQVQPYHYPTKLIGRGLEGLEVKSSDWNAAAAELPRTLKGKDVEALKEMDLGPEKNPTYFFKTRGGTMGVLQLLELVDKPKGIRLRYKTVETGPAGPKQSSADEELKKFQGTWVLVSSEKDGDEKSEEKNPYGLTFTGTRWKVHRGEEVAIEGTLKLVDVTSTPMKLDLLKPRGLGPDPTVDYGIYEWKENTLRYCVCNGPTGSGLPGGLDVSKLRPTEFATKNGDGRILYVWKRAEPSTAAKEAATRSADAAAAEIAKAAIDSEGTAESGPPLEFLVEYPKQREQTEGELKALTAPQFEAAVKARKLRFEKTINDGDPKYYLPTGDGHTVIVMFRDGKWSGIQRIRGEQKPDPARAELPDEPGKP